MLNRFATIIGAVFAIGSLYGCATIVNDEKASLSISSEPDDATVSINGEPVGKTPVTIERPRQNDDLRVRIEKEGYKTAQSTLESSVDLVFFGNIITGGLLGSSTDAATGKMWQYKPNQYHATLVPADQARRDEWNKRMSTLEFTIMSYDELALDMARGDGEYLRALYERLDIAEQQQAQALDQLRAIDDSTGSIPEFAHRVVDNLS